MANPLGYQTEEEATVVLNYMRDKFSHSEFVDVSTIVLSAVLPAEETHTNSALGTTNTVF